MLGVIVLRITIMQCVVMMIGITLSVVMMSVGSMLTVIIKSMIILSDVGLTDTIEVLLPIMSQPARLCKPITI
jgi:hypothetical protein